MDAAWQNRVEALTNLLGIIPMFLAIYGPTWLMLRHLPGPGISASSWLPTLKNRRRSQLSGIISFLSILVSPLSVLLFVTSVPQRLMPFMLFCCMGSSIAIVSGIFEALTCISPRHGFNFRHRVHERYTFHPDVRRAGFVRIAVGLTLPVLCAYILRVIFG